MPKLFFLNIIFLTLYSLHGHAENVALLELSLQELAYVQITGSTLTPKNIKNVPSAATVFTQKEIKRLGLTTLDELMNLVPGYQSYRFSYSSVAYPYSSRGRRSNQFGTDILVMVDGQRISDIATNGMGELVPKYPLRYVERVEFIRGPGSAVFGSNAMLGVINIVTRSGVNELGASAGSFDTWQGHLMASKKIGDVLLDLYAEIEDDNGDEYRLPDTFSDNVIKTDDPLLTANINLKVNWQDTQLFLHFNHYRGENFYQVDRISNGFNYRTGSFAAIALKQSFNWQSVKSNLWVSYNQATHFGLGAQLTAPGDLATISNPSSNEAFFIRTDVNRPEEYRVQIHNDWTIDSESNLQFGVEYRHADTPNLYIKNNFDFGQLSAGNFPIDFYGDLRRTSLLQKAVVIDSLGLYAQYQHQFFEKTHLTLGLRYDNFFKIASRLSPRVGLVQEIGDHHSIKLLYGEAFRAPSPVELGQVNNNVLLGSSNLKPEIVRTWDLIWVGQWSHTSFSLGYFENHFEDAISEVDIGGTLQFVNADLDPSKGLEFELSHELNEYWLLRGTYTYFTTLPDNSTEADRLASLMLNYQHSNWNINISAIYSGERKQATTTANVNDTLDDYWTVFGKLSYNFNKNIRSFVRVKNLLDRNYKTPFRNPRFGKGTPNRGRQIIAGFEWQF